MKCNFRKIQNFLNSTKNHTINTPKHPKHANEHLKKSKTKPQRQPSKTKSKGYNPLSRPHSSDSTSSGRLSGAQEEYRVAHQYTGWATPTSGTAGGKVGGSRKICSATGGQARASLLLQTVALRIDSLQTSAVSTVGGSQMVQRFWDAGGRFWVGPF